MTLDAETALTMTATGGVISLYVSTGGDPGKGWGAEPTGTYPDRVATRLANGKLVHAEGNPATLTLAAGEYVVEVATRAATTLPSYTFTITP